MLESCLLQSSMIETGDIDDSASSAAGKAALSKLAALFTDNKRLLKDCIHNKITCRLPAQVLQGFPLEGSRQVTMSHFSFCLRMLATSHGNFSQICTVCPP